MVKGLEEGQRQKVSCSTMLPFRPTTQNGARPVPPIRVLLLRVCSARPRGLLVAVSQGERDVSHPTTPSGPAYTLTPTFHSITREPNPPP